MISRNYALRLMRRYDHAFEFRMAINRSQAHSDDPAVQKQIDERRKEAQARYRKIRALILSHLSEEDNG